MGIFTRFFGRSEPEKRDLAFAALSPALNEVYTNGGIQSADKLAAVSACVQLIASSISMLPVGLTVDGEPAPASSPAWRLIRRPSQRLSWPALMGWITRELLLTGNAVLRIEADGRGSIVNLQPVPWAWLSPQIVGNRLVFDVWHRHPEAQLLGLPARLLEGDVLHIKGQSEAGIVGQSVLTRARGPIEEGLAIEKLAAANWRNGARPSGAFSLPTFLDENRRKRWDDHVIPAVTGAINAGRTVLLEGGMSYQSLSMNSVDAEFLATRHLNTSQVAMLFGVPEILLQMGQRLPSDMAPFITQFAQLALAPIIASIEAEFDHVVLPPGFHLSIDLDGLQRGSFSAVVSALAALKQGGVISANDARQELGWPAVEGGDRLGPGPAPNYPADFTGSTAMHSSPGPVGDGVAHVSTNQNEGSG